MKKTTKNLILNTASPYNLASLCLLGMAALGGCGDQRAHFADATPLQLARVYSASSGGDLESAMSTALLIAVLSGGNSATGCPTVATKSQDTTISGGCSTEDGTRVEGSIAIHSLLGQNPAGDPSHPISLEFNHYVTSSQHESLALDGRAKISKSSLSGDLTLDAGGLSSTSHLTFACDGHGACSASPGSEIEISDLGSAGVEGTWSLDPPSGSVTVRGADVLIFDIASRDAKGCVPYTVAGKGGTVCPAADENGQGLAGNRLQR